MTQQTPEHEISDAVIAGVAADATLKTPGVLRLEPGLRGLVTSLVRSARQRWNGVEPVATDGIRVRRVEGRLRVDVNVVISGADQAAAVGRSVQRAVARSVLQQTGVETAEVYVSIMDIDLGSR